ncbi:uncharacterized protein CMU_042080 [Cryptosporidium muris RN66]|uniref:CCHC-type domain-containing protein n=1 Tax=Cryptosporidium muris (strain RN66) TaxID=441375 RepID=B6AA94_CRYMR|nr:uncharacterized protein CMU_042080 [Cryptosporidium muris RN66]EEA05135.1 hypothetical protein, conserved [Cryptosporidium muris RN66]|eukprot:XP_002139484.1 hypothetical protein [Cryptosporidium muris RN66]
MFSGKLSNRKFSKEPRRWNYNSKLNRYPIQEINYRQLNEHKWSINRNSTVDNSDEEETVCSIISKYLDSDILWDKYSEYSLNLKDKNHKFVRMRYFDYMKSYCITKRIPMNLIIQQKKFLTVDKRKICSFCVDVHYGTHCNKSRCYICTSKYHSSNNCPWNRGDNKNNISCRHCKGRCYNLSVYSSYLNVKRTVCYNNDNETNKCIKVDYENSIIGLARNSIKYRFAICRTCLEPGHLICDTNNRPYDCPKISYCPLCGEKGHTYRLCQKIQTFIDSDNELNLSLSKNDISICSENSDTSINEDTHRKSSIYNSGSNTLNNTEWKLLDNNTIEHEKTYENKANAIIIKENEIQVDKPQTNENNIQNKGRHYVGKNILFISNNEDSILLQNTKERSTNRNSKDIYHRKKSSFLKLNKNLRIKNRRHFNKNTKGIKRRLSRHKARKP